MDTRGWGRWARARWGAADPQLTQRPVVTADDGTTVVGRTEEAVRSVLP